MRKRPWDPAKLRIAWGDPPPVPAVLVFRSGRRYQVLAVHGKTVHTIVLPPDERGEGPECPWSWASRKKKARR